MSILIGFVSVYFALCGALYNTFAIQWKPQMCYKNSASNCHDDSIGNITIHGIWPNYFAGGWPEYCSGPDLRIQDVEHMTNVLDIYWPTFSTSNTNFAFWSHEWSKHGTCWPNVNPTQYFEYALVWMQTGGYHNIQHILAEHNIYASNENIYSLNDVTKALSEELNQQSVVRCDSSGKYIREFFVCRGWIDNEKIDCPNNLLTSCNDQVILSLQVLPDVDKTTLKNNSITEEEQIYIGIGVIVLLIVFILIGLVLWKYVCTRKGFKQYMSESLADEYGATVQKTEMTYVTY